MPLTFLHTSDWHLGHNVLHHSRDEEHRAFLGWLQETIRSEAPDALIVAGDLFDGANPPASAQAILFTFLAELRGAFPTLDIVLIGGNHDSAARLDAPSDLLTALRVHMVGGLRRYDTEADKVLDMDRLLVPLHDQDGMIADF